MNIHDLLTAGWLTASALYFLTAGGILLKRGLQERTVRSLVLYVTASFLWTSLLAFWRLGHFVFLMDHIVAHMPLYGVLLLSWLFFHLSRSFLRLGRPGRDWWAFGAVCIVVLVILESGALNLPEVLWLRGGWGLEREGLVLGTVVVGWGVLMLGATLLVGKAHRWAEQPLHRNRIKYWPLPLALTVAGDVLLFAQRLTLGSGLRLAGTLVAAYLMLAHRLPDIRQTARRVVSYLIITLLTVVIYTVGFLATQYVFQAVPGYNPLLAGAAMALVLAIIFQPLLRLVQQLVNRLISGAGYDPAHALSEYGLSISNILDLERLEMVIVGVISQAMHIQRGALFLVHPRMEEGDDEHAAQGQAWSFHLQPVQDIGEDALPPGVLHAGSPVADCLSGERRPVTQYDIDLLPRFQGIPPAERDWLASLAMDVYVPIYAKHDWIGLLALGPKVSGDRYFGDDLTLLSTLADQTAVALENARLVENLLQLNQDLRKAYAALDQANRQLQEMDKLKSAFIGVITHELRTPFANLTFSLQLLERYGLENLSPEYREQVEQLALGIKAAKTMIDNLVTFASFLAKQGELRLEQLDFVQVIQEALQPLETMAEGKGIALHSDLPKRLPALCGDRERLADAVYHLAHNAIRFTETGGEVWVHCRVKADAIHFEVKDSGVGVPADKLPTLWEGFAQMADPLQRGVEGLGLGLALVRYVATAHGGQVWADSHEGVGSTFGFQVPLGGPEAQAVDDLDIAVKLRG